MAEGDTLRTLLAALRRLLKVTPVNTVVLRRSWRMRRSSGARTCFDRRPRATKTPGGRTASAVDVTVDHAASCMYSSCQPLAMAIS
jgi:hypothetical protein